MASLHPVLQFHRFPAEHFDLSDVTDYSDSVYMRVKTGPATYHVPTDWQRYALKLRRIDPQHDALADFSVGYWGAALDTFKRVVLSRDFKFDSRVMGSSEKYVFMTPFLEQFVQDAAAPAVPLPVSEFYIFGGSRHFRIALECRMPTARITKYGNQFNELHQRAYEEQSLWRVPIADIAMTAILVKEIPQRPGI